MALLSDLSTRIFHFKKIFGYQYKDNNNDDRELFIDYPAPKGFFSFPR
jgi:hypothetical protein